MISFLRGFILLFTFKIKRLYLFRGDTILGTDITGLETGCWRDVDSTKARILSLIGVSSKSSDSFDSELTSGIGASVTDGDGAVTAAGAARAAAGGVAAVEAVLAFAAVAVPIWLLLLE